jgi:serine/threonine protein kinase
LKLAFSQEDLEKLGVEKRILETIRLRDRSGAAPRYLVNWLHPSSSAQLLNQERIHFLDASGDRISPPSSLLGTGMGMRGLVLELGGCNLKEFLENQDHSSSSVSVTQRVQILSEILEAVSFLHKLNIVHFDLKPENVVSFVSSGGPSRWKLIDFDSSFALTPSSFALLYCESLKFSVWADEGVCGT